MLLVYICCVILNLCVLPAGEYLSPRGFTPPSENVTSLKYYVKMNDANMLIYYVAWSVFLWTVLWFSENKSNQIRYNLCNVRNKRTVNSPCSADLWQKKKYQAHTYAALFYMSHNLYGTIPLQVWSPNLKFIQDLVTNCVSNIQDT